jgi:hypothetical protein
VSDAPDLGPLVSGLKDQLETDFPGWLILREPSGRWSATLPRWGTLYAENAPELRERLCQHAQGFINPDGEGA